MSAPASAATSAWRPAALAGLVALLHAASDLDQRSMWMDEAESLRFSHAPREAFGDSNALLYYWLLWALRRGALPDLYWLRAPSALAFAALAVTAVLLFARLRPASGFAPRLAVGLAVAVHPLLLTHAQDARGYALGAALLLGATLALVARRELLFVPLAVAAIYCHLLALPFVAVQLAGAALVGHGRRARLALAGVAVAAAAAPVLHLNLVTDAANRLWWLRPPGPRVVLSLVAELAGGYATLLPLGALFVALLLLCGALRGGGDRRAHILIATAVLPLCAGIVRSWWSPMTLPRLWLFCVPYAIVWAAVRIDATPARAARLLAGATLAAWIAGCVLLHVRGRNEPWREAFDLVRTAARPGDHVWLPGVSGPFVYYAAREGLPGLVPLGPCATWVLPQSACPRAIQPTLAGFARGRGRVWVIVNRSGFAAVEAMKGVGLLLVRSELLMGWPIRDLYQGPRGATIDVHLFDK